jgi:hypothetical protein
MKRVWLAALALSIICTAAPPTDEIVERSVANTMADWNTAPEYNFTERDVVTKKGPSARTYRVMMIDGSPYNKLIAANGEPLTPAQAAGQDRALQREIAKREHATPEVRLQRIQKYQRERRQDNALMQEMTKAMDFRLSGEDTVDGRRCFVLEGTPKPGYRPASRDAKVLKGMRGKMWIDEQQYQWVKVEAEVFRPVAFGLFIAHVEPGTQFTLEQRPVEGNLWLPSHFSMRVKAKVLGYWSRNSTADETYWKYSRAS